MSLMRLGFIRLLLCKVAVLRLYEVGQYMYRYIPVSSNCHLLSQVLTSCILLPVYVAYSGILSEITFRTLHAYYQME